MHVNLSTLASYLHVISNFIHIYSLLPHDHSYPFIFHSFSQSCSQFSFHCAVCLTTRPQESSLQTTKFSKESSLQTTKFSKESSLQTTKFSKESSLQTTKFSKESSLQNVASFSFHYFLVSLRPSSSCLRLFPLVVSRDKFVPVYATQAYRGSRDTAPLLLNLASRWVEWSA